MMTSKYNQPCVTDIWITKYTFLQHIWLLVVEAQSFEGLNMRLSTIRLNIRLILWLLPLISLTICGIFLIERNKRDIQLARQEQKTSYKNDTRGDMELPVISICSRNQFSQRDTDKILEMEDWRNINLQYWWQLYYFRNITLSYTQFMSVFRNFAMYKMSPDEIQNFTEDQKEFLGYHRINFARLIKHQVKYVV